MNKWTEERALRIKYDAAKYTHGRGDYFEYEGNGGMAMRLYKSGYRVWYVVGSRRNPDTGKFKAAFVKVGVVSKMSLKDARLEAGKIKEELTKGVNRSEAKRQATTERRASNTLIDTTVRTALTYWLEGRNCAPSSKPVLKSLFTANLDTLMDRPMLGITTDELRACYLAAIKRVEADEAARVKKLATLPADQQLLQAAPGYYNGKKTGHDLLEGFGRVYRYWVKMHAGELQQAGVTVPVCPVDALLDDRIPVGRRVKSIPPADLKKLLASLKTYPGNQLHPPLVRLLLATGARVGALLNTKWEHVSDDRITIPADVSQSKVQWKNRHLESMAKVIPITPAIRKILKELGAVGKLYGDSKTWLFPSRESVTGHMTEEKSATLRLRKHAGIRFTLHQLRHCVATAAEDLDYSHAEIAELLGHGGGANDVTARYIDSKLVRHSAMLTAIGGSITNLCAPVRNRA